MRSSYLKCFFYLVWKELVVFSKVLRSRIVDSIIIVTTNILVFTYLMPHFGLKTGYGFFIFVGIIPIISFFEVITNVSTFVSDITGNKKISYSLTLPLPSFLVFASIGVGWAFCNMMFTIFLIPIGKLLLWDKFDLSGFSFFKFISIFLTVNLFYGFFALWLSGIIKDMKYMSWIWARVVNPLFMLGGFFYSWGTLYKASKIFGFLNLLNPVIYSLEGFRAAVMGQKGFLSFYFCFLVLWVFIFLFFLHANFLLKRRLDVV
jgi:ABC-type polysaccharide/polyol phosphate export permease